jgi:hypothetical protein
MRTAPPWADDHGPSGLSGPKCLLHGGERGLSFFLRRRRFDPLAEDLGRQSSAGLILRWMGRRSCLRPEMWRPRPAQIPLLGPQCTLHSDTSKIPRFGLANRACVCACRHLRPYDARGSVVVTAQAYFLPAGDVPSSPFS